jgi:monoamine oxidase
MARKRLDAIVIGAGAAGLAAARGLSDAGLTAVVLEARDRIGGRIYTVRDSCWPLALELGAEFLHGDATPTREAATAAGLLVHELPERHVWSRAGRWRSVTDFWPRFTRLCAQIPTQGRDRSFAEFLSSRRGLSREVRTLARMLVEGYHAAPIDEVSAQSLAADPPDDAPVRNQQHRLPHGYDDVLTWLRSVLAPERVSVRLNTPVLAVRWWRGSVVADCLSASGARLPPFRARAAIVTLPVGVLQAESGTPGTVRFDPPLDRKQRALAGFGEAPVQKIVLRFRRAFWEEAAFLAARAGPRAMVPQYFHDASAAFPTWWTSAPARAPILTGWAGGPAAARLATHSSAMVLSQALETLSRILGVARTWLDDRLDGWARHDWHADPWSRGAYTFLKVGHAQAPRALAQPIDGTLFFAGESTSADEMGTVPGALTSGTRAARQVQRQLEGRPLR